MQKDKRLYGDPFVPVEIQAEGDGLRAAYKNLLELIDVSEPAWPAIAGALRELVSSGVELDETSVPVAIKLGRRRWERTASLPSSTDVPVVQLTLTASSDAIVYYIRRGDLIKIGTTANPHARFGDLLPDEILAIEPGSYELESQRHQQFRHLRTRREYFRPAAELTDHAARLRLLHGDPDPSWPTSAALERSRFQSGLPQPVSGETMTAMEAVERLGIKMGTLRGWKHRRKILPVGRDEEGRLTFFAEHLVLLRDGYLTRSNEVA